MTRSVFISGTLPVAVSDALKKSGFSITQQSLIETTAIPFESRLPECDWIFFSSKNAARFFFASTPQIGNQKIAAIGKGTASIVEQVIPVDFIGRQNDIAEVAKEFAAIAGKGKILFPQSALSLRTVQSAFPVTQIIDLVCYETKSILREIQSHDIYVFTSPSNVASFFMKNTINGATGIIAYGRGTSLALKNKGVSEVIVPQSLENNDLLNTILSCSVS